MTQIRNGLKTALDAIPDCQVSAYQLDNPSPPTLQVMGLDEIQYDQAMARGLDEITVIVQAFAGTPVDRASQDILDGWMVYAVKDAIEADRTLGGIIEDCVVDRTNGARIYNLPNRAETLGTDFFVRVLNTGN